MDKSRGMGRNGPWAGGQLKERPSAVFKEHVRVAPYPEDDIPTLVDMLGGDDSCLVFGSDFPHAEGVAKPSEFEAAMEGMSDAAKHRVMRTNAEAIFDRA
jgi:predicted TIM-barrel fold metal-dependent hydrolase